MDDRRSCDGRSRRGPGPRRAGLRGPFHFTPAEHAFGTCAACGHETADPGGAARAQASRATASSSYAETLGAAPANQQPFERARTLEEANARFDLLNERLRALEERLQKLDAGKARGQTPH